MLGFDLNTGDAAPARQTPAPGASQRKAAAAAKTRRRERRGERRARGSAAKPKRR
jgi:23S rRNA pseudouridine955/2504/2580 synthase